MRKYILGIAVVIIFLAYSTVLRHQHSEAVIEPESLTQNTSSGSGTATTTTPDTTSVTSSSQYTDGRYVGSVANAYYGNVQVSATVENGKITTIDLLQSPDENPNSIYINQTAIPYLKQEAIKAQSSKVGVITGATFTSQAFSESLANALRQAQAS